MTDFHSAILSEADEMIYLRFPDLRCGDIAIGHDEIKDFLHSEIKRAVEETVNNIKSMYFECDQCGTGILGKDIKDISLLSTLTSSNKEEK